MKKTLAVIKNLLLAFVLISIGFALGKHFAASKSTPDAAEKPASSIVRVYYLHGTVRCVTCNRIEEMTKKLLNDKYGKEMTAGKIEFVDVDFQKNEVLAKSFQISGSCVVVAEVYLGEIVFWKRLDRVWELFDEPDEFNAYISDGIKAALGPERRNK
jgi:hypothetical protein